MGRWLERKTDVNVVVTENYEEMSVAAANVIAEQLKAKPDSVLGLATGTTPIGLYAELVRACDAGEISFANAQSFNLDEYRGLPGTHDQSYRYFMQDNLFDHVDIDVEKTHVPDGSMEDAQAACEHTNTQLRKQAVLICSFWAWDTTGTSDLTSRVIPSP